MAGSVKEPQEGALRVWWVPQVPMTAFYVPVQSEEEAVLVLDTLARYDAFQFENNVKPDYCNIGGLQLFESDINDDGSGGWCDWYDEETGSDDPVEYVKEKNEQAVK